MSLQLYLKNVKTKQIIAKSLLGGDGADVGNILGGLGLNGLLGSSGSLSGILGSAGNLGGVLGSSGGDDSGDCVQPPPLTFPTQACPPPLPLPSPTLAPATPSFSFAPAPQPVPVRIPAPCPQSVTIPNIIVALLPPTPKKPVCPRPVARPAPIYQPQPIVVPVPQPRFIPVYESVCGC
ncbi:hypothetical protein V9T40_003629 [Parthenolecanium corni]|uniref:Uncharacterized protein n=1 Tax=Parthenolecanium corni TaxID=536013 RepID=A0AAN9TR20_9HEMI